MKFRTFAAVLCLVLCCLCFACCNTPVTKPDTTKPTDTTKPGDTSNPPAEAKPLLGVWWWKDSLGDEYLDFAQQNNVTEIYFCSSKFNETTEAFIQKANERHIDVFWLAGEYQWVENPASLTKQMQRFVQYQQTHTFVFKGIHFDIEPHQHKEFKTRRAELLTMFAELVSQLKKDYPDIWLEYDIPFWIEDEITLDGITKPAFQHIMDNASRVTLMSYRDTAEKIYKVAQAEIEYALQTGKILNLGVETYSTEGDQVSFMEEGRQYMYQEIAKLRNMVPSNFGVVIHQIKQWYDLKD